MLSESPLRMVIIAVIHGEVISVNSDCVRVFMKHEFLPEEQGKRIQRKEKTLERGNLIKQKC